MSSKGISFRSCLAVEECLFACELGRGIRLEIGVGELDLERFSSPASDSKASRCGRNSAGNSPRGLGCSWPKWLMCWARYLPSLFRPLQLLLFLPDLTTRADLRSNDEGEGCGHQCCSYENIAMPEVPRPAEGQRYKKRSRRPNVPLHCFLPLNGEPDTAPWSSGEAEEENWGSREVSPCYED